MNQTTIKTSPVDIDERKKIDLSPGTTVRVWLKIEEKGKIRLQAYEGLVIARKHGTEPGATFTVRKVASGVGMEKIFPLYSPVIDHIDIVKRSKVRRAKLYYIRDKAAKEIRRRMKQLSDEAMAKIRGEEERVKKEQAEIEEKAKALALKKAEEAKKAEEVKNEEVAEEAKEVETEKKEEKTEAESKK